MIDVHLARRVGLAVTTVFVGGVLLLTAPAGADQAPAARLGPWRQLPDLPRPLGGQIAGLSGRALIIAGGTDFPVPLFQGGQRRWYNSVYVLEPGATTWRAAAPLPRPLAYAGVVTLEDGIVVIGGSDSGEHHADVFRLRWHEGRINYTPLAALPAPVAMLGAAALGRTLYAAGGQERPTSPEASRSVWALDLSAVGQSWAPVEPLPGPGRILPVVVAQDGAVHVFSGAELTAGADGSVTRRYLTDAYRFRPGRGWSRMADLPRPAVAAPAVPYGAAHILVLGGDTGVDAARVRELRDHHPGFSREALAHHTITDTWTRVGTMPAGLVTTTAVRRGDAIVIPGGEDRPGHRAGAVLEADLTIAAHPFFTIDYIVVAAYLLPLLVIGFRFSRSNATTEDFFLGGRRIPWWAAGLSIYGTQLSAITFLAIPAKAYAEDWVYFVGNLCIILVAPVVSLFYLPFFRGLAITTAYEYLEHRFSLAVRLFGSAAFIALQSARMTIVLYLPAMALAAATGIDVRLSIVVMGMLCTAYTMEGGMRAVIWTDVVQVFVLVGSAILSLVLIVTSIDGGPARVLEIGAGAGKFHMLNWTWDASVASVWVVVLGSFFAHLVPYTADQAVIQRYLSTRDEQQAARAVWTGALLTVPTSVLFFGVGTALFVFYKTHPSLLNPAVQTDATFSWFIAQQLPAGVSGLAVSGVFAAAMSTLSSSINSITTVIVTDFHARFRPAGSEAARMSLARRLVLAVGGGGTLSALVLTTWDIRSLWDLFLQSVGLFGSGLAGLFVLGIFTRRANGRGALAGALASVAVLYFVQRHTPVHFFLYAVIGVASCVSVGYAASRLMPSAARSLEGLTIFTRRRLTAGSAVETGGMS